MLLGEGRLTLVHFWTVHDMTGLLHDFVIPLQAIWMPERLKAEAKEAEPQTVQILREI